MLRGVPFRVLCYGPLVSLQKRSPGSTPGKGDSVLFLVLFVCLMGGWVGYFVGGWVGGGLLHLLLVWTPVMLCCASSTHLYPCGKRGGGWRRGGGYDKCWAAFLHLVEATRWECNVLWYKCVRIVVLFVHEDSPIHTVGTAPTLGKPRTGVQL